jgi:hypothetical protein
MRIGFPEEQGNSPVRFLHEIQRAPNAVVNLAVRAGRQLHHRRVSDRWTVLCPLRKITQRKVSMLILADADPLVGADGLGEPVFEADLHVDVLIGRPSGSNDGKFFNIWPEMCGEELGEVDAAVLPGGLDDRPK